VKALRRFTPRKPVVFMATNTRQKTRCYLTVAAVAVESAQIKETPVICEKGNFKMAKIIRTPTSAKGGITPDEKMRMDEHASSWISNAMRTDSCDRPRLTAAIKELYRVSGLKEPRVIIVPSPLVMAMAGGFSAAIWWLRKNGAATDAATDAATRAATGAATGAATYAATDAATRAERFAQLAHEILGEHAVFGLKCAQNWYSMYQGGNMWSAYDCYLTACRDILGLQLPEFEKYAAWEQAALNGGFRIMHEEFCMVSDFPCRLKVDDQNRPHCADGPSHEWRDGWKLYHWHGVRLDGQIIEAPETLTVAQIESESNAEIRRVMIERYGPKRYLSDSGATVVQELPADHFIIGLRTARLLRKEVPDDEPIIMIDLLNSTAEPDGSVKRYLLRVQPDAYGGEASRSCLAAAASTWRMPDGALAFKRPQDYAPVFES
jgi:hypothetical protein